MADRKYVHKHVSSLAVQMLYRRQLMIDIMLHTSPELVILARNVNKINVYLSCITRYKYATNTEHSFGQIKIIIY